jgi:hypothetical protein
MNHLATLGPAIATGQVLVRALASTVRFFYLKIIRKPGPNPTNFYEYL